MSPLRIEDMTSGSRIARGSGCGSSTGFVAALSLPYFDCLNKKTLPVMSVPQRGTNPEELEHAPGRERENLEGWIPQLASDDEVRAALEKAFDYRGDVSITLKSGEKIDGYIFDRRTGKTLFDSAVRLYPKSDNEKRTISYSDIAAVAFTGKDTAAGKSWEAWMKKYNEKKAAGEKNIALHPEALE
jgi:hypothetical protein